MEKRWTYKPLPDQEKQTALSEAININASLAALLFQRGICGYEEAKDFFRPSLSHLHDPFLMKDMDRAVARLEKALATKEKILIYGDYDVDGTTSVSLVYGFLKKIYDFIDFYIPDRHAEGYGISAKGIEWALENNFTLIISLDCGIKSVELINYAATIGIDFIICDHHKPGEELPGAVAVLDPKRHDCGYPFKELSGCGVGFKLLQAFCSKNNIDSKELFDSLDLLAVSIASDIVPIVGENRVLTYFGLKQLNKNARPGIKALIGLAGFKKELDVTNVVFGIGPRINAAGRIAHAKTAVQLLLSATDEEAGHFAQQIDDRNTTRRDYDMSITEEALQMIERNVMSKAAKSTVLYKEDWHKGVIGIVASRCIEKYYRPTIILTQSNNHATGSARSVAGFDVYAAIAKCSDLLEQYGGHMYAAGLTLKVDNVLAFQRKFEEVVSELITQEQLIPHIPVDLKLELNQINQKFYNVMKQMAPFGPENMQPVFVSENVYDTGRSRLIKEQHLKLFIQQENSDPVEGIGFGMASFFPRIAAGEKFDICYSLCENEFNGTKTLQLSIRDIKFK